MDKEKEIDWTMSVEGDFIRKLMFFMMHTQKACGRGVKNFSATITYDAEMDRYKLTTKLISH